MRANYRNVLWGDKTAVQLEGDLLCPTFGPIPLYLLDQRFQHKVKCLWLTGWLNYQGWNVTVLVKRSTETLSDCGSIDTLAPITKHRLSYQARRVRSYPLALKGNGILCSALGLCSRRLNSAPAGYATARTVAN